MNKSRVDLFHDAVMAFQQNDYSQAIFLFEIALNKPFLGLGNIDNGLILNNIATVYNKMGEYEKSAQFYERAIAEGLTNDDIYFSLAITYVRGGKNQKALPIYNLLVDRNPNNGKAYFLRGKHYQRMGEYIKGSNDLGKAASLGYFG